MDNDELELTEEELDDYVEALDIAEQVWEENKRRGRKKKMKIILYHQDSCGQCKMAELILKKANIDYISCKDIEEMKSLNISSTPTLAVDGVLYYGVKSIRDWIESRD